MRRCGRCAGNWVLREGQLGRGEAAEASGAMRAKAAATCAQGLRATDVSGVGCGASCRCNSVLPPLLQPDKTDAGASAGPEIGAWGYLLWRGVSSQGALPSTAGPLNVHACALTACILIFALGRSLGPCNPGGAQCTAVMMGSSLLASARVYLLLWRESHLHAGSLELQREGSALERCT